MSAKKVAKVAIENDQNNSYQDESSNDMSNNKMEGDHKSKVAKNAKKVATKYHCNICDYISSNKYNYEKHIISNKHNEKISTIKNKYNCEICHYHSGNKYNYNKHMDSVKHMEALQMHTEALQMHTESLQMHTEALQMHTESLQMQTESLQIIRNREKEETKTYNIQDVASQDQINGIKSELFVSIMSEMKFLMTEQNKIIQEIVNKPSTNITNFNNQTNNQQFNMNVFLNETCKDAMNLSEFIDNLQVSMEDMEKTGELGFAKGMSRIIMNNLNAIDICKRPIHCSDVKRETLYVKNNGVWEKETEERKRTKEIIYKVSCLNTRQLLKWRDLPRNKGYEKSDHKKNDEFTKLVMEIHKLREEEIDKVITNISKHVVIDKDKVNMSGYLN